MNSSSKFYLIIKRGLDILFSLIILLILLIPFVIIAFITFCIIKSAPIYSQIRLGKDKKPFKMYKFRSYKIGMPEIPPYKANKAEMDKYRYPWGDFLRKTSIDELPQLFNVLIGNMSFIGPRPGAKENEDELIKARDELTPSPYLVKPGLTGLAQVKLKRDHNPYNKAKYDSLYVSDISFVLDLKILVTTFTVLFKD